MGTNYRPYEPDQPLLVCAVAAGLAAAEHFISDKLDQLDLSPLHQPYQPGGRGNWPAFLIG